MPLAQAALTLSGLAHDRDFMVVDRDWSFRSQRRDPRLALIRPEVTTDPEETLTLRGPGVEPVRIAVDTAGPRREVALFGRPTLGIDQGDAAAGWLSEVLGARSRLVRMPPEHHRITDGLTPGRAGYADSGAVHVVSLASLDLLNERIAARGGDPVAMSRFRPNVVAGGWAEPHAEDEPRDLSVGDARLAFAKLATRCAVCLVDQDTGERAGPDPIRTLAGYRRAAGGVTFGAKYSVLTPGKLSVGDAIHADGPAGRVPVS
jgi:uncharacterized protein YcbX